MTIDSASQYHMREDSVHVKTSPGYSLQAVNLGTCIVFDLDLVNWVVCG